MAKRDLVFNSIELIEMSQFEREWHLKITNCNRDFSFGFTVEQAWGLAMVIKQLLEELGELPSEIKILDNNFSNKVSEKIFDVGHMQVEYDANSNSVYLVLFRRVNDISIHQSTKVNSVELCCSIEQIYNLSERTLEMVRATWIGVGSNGRLIYYWK